LYITPVIYLFLDKYSGSGPMKDGDIDDGSATEPAQPVELRAIKAAKH
jgi:HAE1 family hydrophobic/amphiphilic exporter-1